MLRKLTEIVFGKQAAQVVGSWTMLFKAAPFSYEHRKKYLSREALVGARVLGPIPSGHEREFFCLDRHTWIWHESWKDEHGQRQQFTVNYEIDPSGILKRVNGGQYTKLSGEELKRFNDAILAYYTEVSRQVYGVQAPALG